MRLLGIPTVTDRFLQQAILQIITAKFEFEFSDNSFGFRPNRNLHQAVIKAQGYINEGYQHIVDIDLIPIMNFVGFVEQNLTNPISGLR